MNIEEVILRFRFCPLCKATLQKQPMNTHEDRLYCPQHGDFFVTRFTGQEPAIVFKPFSTYSSGWYRTGRHHIKVKCNETGDIYETLTEAAKTMGVGKSNLSKHLRRMPGHKSVGGHTYSFVEIRN